ncbi:MAG TPA: hypothetical protein VF679_01025 [Pedobacter sp.]
MGPDENDFDSSSAQKMTQVEVLHDFRKRVDAVIQFAELLIKDNDFNPNIGRELALVRTKLQEGKMWAGKALEVAGSELPAEFQDKAERII